MKSSYNRTEYIRPSRSSNENGTAVLCNPIQKIYLEFVLRKCRYTELLISLRNIETVILLYYHYSISWGLLGHFGHLRKAIEWIALSINRGIFCNTESSAMNCFQLRSTSCSLLQNMCYSIHFYLWVLCGRERFQDSRELPEVIFKSMTPHDLW